MKVLKPLKNMIAKRILKEDFVESYVQEKISLAYPESYQISEFKANDVFIVGYPKSGNTWMQNLVAGLVYGVCGEYASGRLVQELVPDVHYKTHYQRFTGASYFKSHLLPRSEYKRVIYIVRDGRDALVSFKHYRQAIEGKEIDWVSIEKQMEERWGDWSSHVSSWIENPYKADFLLIKYENLISMPLFELIKIASFLKVDMCKEELEKILSSTSFKRLEDREKKHGFGNRNFPKDKAFFRKGIIGSYKDELPDNLMRNYVIRHGDVLKYLGYMDNI